MIGSVNRFMCEKAGAAKHANVTISRLMPNGDLEFINCGGVPPLIVSGTSVKRVEEGNLPVGLISAADFKASRLQLKPGDRLLVVTAGVTESENSAGEFFGAERLESCCRGGFAAVE